MLDTPTLRDVAARAGVGKSTAQRALANDPRCSEATREKVRRVASEMGYLPDPVFAAMGSRRRTRGAKGAAQIAYLVAHPPRSMQAGAKYIPGCTARAADLGYRLEVIDLAKLEAPKSLWQTLFARGFVGVIVGSVRQDFHDILLTNTLFPVVCAGRLDPLPFHTVRPAIQAGMRRTWETLTGLGYRRIGAAVFRHEPMLEDDFSRFSAAVGSHTLDFPDDEPVPPLCCGFGREALFMPWVERHRPDAVIGFHDGLLNLLKDAGYKVPADIGFASLHREKKGICGLHEDAGACAVSAVNFLDQIIRHGERGIPETPINLMIEATWMEGGTLRRNSGATA